MGPVETFGVLAGFVLVSVTLWSATKLVRRGKTTQTRAAKTRTAGNAQKGNTSQEEKPILGVSDSRSLGDLLRRGPKTEEEARAKKIEEEKAKRKKQEAEEEEKRKKELDQRSEEIADFSTGIETTLQTMVDLQDKLGSRKAPNSPLWKACLDKLKYKPLARVHHWHSNELAIEEINVLQGFIKLKEICKRADVMITVGLGYVSVGYIDITVIRIEPTRPFEIDIHRATKPFEGGKGPLSG